MSSLLSNSHVQLLIPRISRSDLCQQALSLHWMSLIIQGLILVPGNSILLWCVWICIFMSNAFFSSIFSKFFGSELAASIWSKAYNMPAQFIFGMHNKFLESIKCFVFLLQWHYFGVRQKIINECHIVARLSVGDSQVLKDCAFMLP